ncbi:MAG: MBL fold metallo-hydrolase [Dehalococcoidia bacterium]|nr:MBL fold metallo-hydrolase [Dehalococcoidia bacterium]
MDGTRRIELAYNNVYVVERAGVRVLIDTGPDYAGAQEALLGALDGREPDLVVATHGHSDHAGLGAAWQERGVPVAIGQADTRLVGQPPLSDEGEFAAMAAYVEECGAPAGVQRELMQGLAQRREWAARAAEPGPHPEVSSRGARWPSGLRMVSFVPDQELPGPVDPLPGGLEAIACPGHTPGNLVVVDRDAGLLFSGDQLLPGITPTPGIQAVPEGDGWTRQRTLPLFVASLQSLREIPLKTCYPGHGEPFENPAERIAETLDAIETRTRKVKEAVERREPTTPYLVAEALYPKLLGRKAWQTLASVQGHLDLLADRNEIAECGGEYALTG